MPSGPELLDVGCVSDHLASHCCFWGKAIGGPKPGVERVAVFFCIRCLQFEALDYRIFVGFYSYAFWWCVYIYIITCMCQRTRYRRTNPHPVAWGGVGWDNNVIGISTWTWCYALWPSIAIPHELDATLYDLQLKFHTSASNVRVGVGRGGVGWDNNVIGISTWTWCYALWISLAFPHDLDATLYDLHWHFHMNLMLRSMIFNCNSTWSWCYALWSSLAFPHEPDATLYDLQLQFHTSASDSLGWGGVG